MADWPWQPEAVTRTLAAIDRGRYKLALSCFTGGGKTRIVSQIVKRFVDDGKRIVLYANRKMLIRQLSDQMNALEVPHGIRAADTSPEHHHPFQIASIQTEGSRTLRRKERSLHAADVVIFDEGHLHTTGEARELAMAHLEHHAIVIYLTATPVGLAEVADELILVGTKEEGRRHGALVPAVHYGPDEPDLASIGTINPGEDVTEEQARKLMGAVSASFTPNARMKSLFGRIGQHYKRLNPEQKPTLLFAPGVQESLWLCEQFNKAGIPAAHIDGESIWYGHRKENGVIDMIPSTEESREELRDESREGRVKVICNRFVLREGIDYPWIEHLIFATVFGNIAVCTQVGGRGLRASPATGKTRCIIQDHGGNWWRYGSLNNDPPWALDLTGSQISRAMADDLREGTKPEPRVCPKCCMILMSKVCPCGFEVSARARPVLTSDGELVELRGAIIPPKKRQFREGTIEKWKKIYFRARNSKNRMSFAQAEGLFAKENYHLPPRDLPFMPYSAFDWYRAVADVPYERLRTSHTPPAPKEKKKRLKPPEMRLWNPEDYHGEVR